jgi:formate hydrogenlyase subunit 3/multisubunit Na+/H+ antiporter MnhD subunit
MVGASAAEPKLMAAGLVAGTAQVMAHALAKTLLFVSASTIEAATGTTDLDRLGGVVGRLPWAGTGLVIGSLTLDGLPMTAGFASEWFTLESLMQQFRVSNLAMQLTTAVTGALIALTIGIAGVTFVRVVALTAFGPARLAEPPIDPAMCC